MAGDCRRRQATWNWPLSTAASLFLLEGLVILGLVATSGLGLRSRRSHRRRPSVSIVVAAVVTIGAGLKLFPLLRAVRCGGPAWLRRPVVWLATPTLQSAAAGRGHGRSLGGLLWSGCAIGTARRRGRRQEGGAPADRLDEGTPAPVVAGMLLTAWKHGRGSTRCGADCNRRED